MALRGNLPLALTPKDLLNSHNKKVRELQENDFTCSAKNIDTPSGLHNLNNSLQRGLTLEGKSYPNGISLLQLKTLFPNHWIALLSHISQWSLCIDMLHSSFIIDNYSKHVFGDQLIFSKNFQPDQANEAIPNIRNIYTDTLGHVYLDVQTTIELGCVAVTNESQFRTRCLVRSKAELTRKGFKFISFSTDAPIVPLLWEGDSEKLKEYMIPSNTEQSQPQPLQPEPQPQPLITEQTSWNFRGIIASVVDLFRNIFSRNSESLATNGSSRAQRNGNSNSHIQSLLPTVSSTEDVTKKPVLSSRWNSLSQLFQSTVVSGNTEAVNVYDSFSKENNQLRM